MASPTDDFKIGSIVRIKLKDFVTYDDVEFRPGPHLNVVIGPNGSGKSSLVCAICLGLCGAPTLLGRGSSVSDYVKHKKDNAVIEIELKGKLKNIIIQRTIHSDNKSDWYLNGSQSTQAKIKGIVANFNIQLDNLCQFLPQDKVTSFAKSSTVDILALTQQMVGTDAMRKEYKNLVELQRQQLSEQAGDSTQMAELNKLRDQNERLRPEVDRYEDRERMEKDLHLVKAKHAWLEYGEMKKEYLESKKRVGSVANEIEITKKLNAPMIMKQAKLEEDWRTAAFADDQNKTAAEDKYKKATNVADEVAQLQERYDNALGRKAAAEKSKMEGEKKIEKLQMDYSAIAAKLQEEEEKNSKVDYKASITQYNTRKRELKGLITDINERITNMNIEHQQSSRIHQIAENELRRINDQDRKKLEWLRQKSKEAFDATQWLRNNKNLFKEEVYEPVLTQIKLTEPQHQKVVENTIPWPIATAFVAQNADDQETFSRHVLDQQKLQINILRAPPPNTHFQESETKANLARNGFTGILKDLYSAPDAVKRTLCARAHHHDIPVGPASLAEPSKMDFILANVKTKRFYAGDMCINRSQSSYGNKGMLIRQDYVRGKNMLFTDNEGDASKVEEAKNALTESQKTRQKLEGEIEKAQEKKKEINQKLTVIEESIALLKRDMESAGTLKSALKQQKAALENEKNKITTNVVLIKTLSTEVHKLNTIRGRKLLAVHQLLDQVVKMYHASTVDGLRLGYLHVKQEQFRVKFKESTLQLEALEKTWEEYKAIMHETKQKTRDSLAKAREYGSPDDPEVQAALEQYSDDLDELKEKIYELQANLDSSLSVDKSVVSEYHRRARRIQELDKNIKSLHVRRQEMEENLSECEKRWLTPLKNLVTQINDKFAKFFQRMGCAGEVVLDNNHVEYTNYGIEIRVKFREKDLLHKLTAHHQSGGERSVSTILYLMSFQRLANAPFRIVDEINQGMDPKNERAVFETVANEATSDGSSQYFLITPKLLSGLEYNPRITVLCVFNGQYINASHQEWDMGTFIQRKRALACA
eukprot:CFRG5823T1